MKKTLEQWLAKRRFNRALDKAEVILKAAIAKLEEGDE